MTTVNGLRCQNYELKNEIITFKECNQTMMKHMNNSIKQLVMLPVSRVITNTTRSTSITNISNRGNRIDAGAVNNN